MPLSARGEAVVHHPGYTSAPAATGTVSSPGHSWQEAAGGIVAGTAAAAEVRPIEAAAVVVGIHSLVAVEEVAGSRIGAAAGSHILAGEEDGSCGSPVLDKPY